MKWLSCLTTAITQPDKLMESFVIRFLYKNKGLEYKYIWTTQLLHLINMEYKITGVKELHRSNKAKYFEIDLTNIWFDVNEYDSLSKVKIKFLHGMKSSAGFT